MPTPKRSLTVVALVLASACSEAAPTIAPETAAADPESAEPASGVAAAQVQPPAADPSGPPPEIARPYREGADAQAEIDAAVARARADGKRVLLMFGANWCVWCRRLAWVFENEPRVSAALAEGWHVVHVDTGTRGSPAHPDVVARYGNPLQHGLPCLVVLDGQGNLVHTQETGSLESGDRHDPERVLAFLSRYRR